MGDSMEDPDPRQTQPDTPPPEAVHDPLGAALAAVEPPPEEQIIVLRPSGPDRWRHRRGEPRLAAFLWTAFLMAATCVLFSAILKAGFRDIYLGAANVLVTTTAAGAVLLWPTLRLSQAPPRRPSASFLLDVLVIWAPTLAIIWPQGLLAGWGVGIPLALTALLLAWCLLNAAWLTLVMKVGGLERIFKSPRLVGALGVIAINLGGPTLGLLSTAINPPAAPGSVVLSDRWMQTSAITATLRLTDPRIPRIGVPLVPWQFWAGVGVTAAIGVVGWGLVALVPAGASGNHQIPGDEELRRS